MTDLMFALRQSLKHPGLTAVAGLTLAHPWIERESAGRFLHGRHAAGVGRGLCMLAASAADGAGGTDGGVAE